MGEYLSFLSIHWNPTILDSIVVDGVKLKISERSAK